MYKTKYLKYFLYINLESYKKCSNFLLQLSNIILEIQEEKESLLYLPIYFVFFFPSRYFRAPFIIFSI